MVTTDALRPKLALLSMDVEDWYHLEYFQRHDLREPSMLDGVERFRDLLAVEQVPATFFVVGDIARARPDLLHGLVAAGHEVASHGPDHQLLKGVPPADFAMALAVDKANVEQILGREVCGYRAPCFSMNCDQLHRLPEIGFAYDSSFIRFAYHPLYVAMDLTQWAEVCRGVRRMPGGAFLEFEVPTVRIGKIRLPFAGGAYFRALPWLAFRWLLSVHLAEADVFVFYVHPFECSSQQLSAYPSGTGRADRLRFEIGRHATLDRVARLVHLLRERGFQFDTFSAAHKRFVG